MFLLLGLFCRLQKRLRRNWWWTSEDAALRLSFVVSIVIYNVTESAFNRMDIVWLALLLFIVEIRKSRPWIGRNAGIVRAGDADPTRPARRVDRLS